MANSKTGRISFTVSGHVSQDIMIVKKGYTLEKISDLLDEGELLTTMVEGHDSYIEDLAGNRIAKIISQDNECSYQDFDYRGVN